MYEDIYTFSMLAISAETKLRNTVFGEICLKKCILII